MDAPSFISSFKAFKQVPAGALFAVALFFLAEMAGAILWRPALVGERLYATFTPTYDYGFASDVPQLFREGESYRFYPSEYVNMRSFAIAAQKEPGTIRIFTLGASVSRGSGLPPGADYSYRLQALLNEGYPEHSWEVVNLSADGFGTTRMLNVLLNMVRYGPDLLILHLHGTNEYEDEHFSEYRRELHSGLNGFLLRSRFLVLLKKTENRILANGSVEGVTAEAEEMAGLDLQNSRRWMMTMQENLERFECVTEVLDVPAIYIGRAERDGESYGGERVDRLNGPIRSEAHFVDVAGAFEALDGEYSSSDLFFDNTHYSELGHRIVAEKLFELVRPGGPVYEEARRGSMSAPSLAPEVVEERCKATGGA